MAYTDIDNPELYFQTKLYTGNGGTQSITLDGSKNMQPDWTWIKKRNGAADSSLMDSVRGVRKSLRSNSTAADYTESSGFSSFDSNGFSFDGTAYNHVNRSSDTFVAWNWLAGGSASSNSNGDITSSVSANTTSGFSIVLWTGSSASATIGHGLSSAPELVIVKNRTDSSTDWRIGNTVVSGKTMADDNGYYLEFDTGAIANPGSKTIWGSGPSAPTSTVFSVGSNNSNNGSSDNMIAYCFHSVKGYSKIGSYTGNGNTNGTFVYTGFLPAWVMVKKSNSTGKWVIWDNKRNDDAPAGGNYIDRLLYANASDAEVDTGGSLQIDFLSGGFKLRGTGTDCNASGSTYIYMAFAESPFVNSNGIPTNAR